MTTHHERKVMVNNQRRDAYNMTTTPQFELLPRYVYCARHGEPFAECWPSGYANFAIIALETANDQPGFIDQVRMMRETIEREDAPGEVADMAKPADIDPRATYNRLLAAKPLCCRMTPDALLQAYGATQAVVRGGLWPMGVCDLCGMAGMGCVYRQQHPQQFGGLPADAPRWPHVCLRCVSHRAPVPPHGYWLRGNAVGKSLDAAQRHDAMRAGRVDRAARLARFKR